jgi:signal transduction histidine kinase/DNA-binding response OmpR family regulator
LEENGTFWDTRYEWQDPKTSVASRVGMKFKFSASPVAAELIGRVLKKEILCLDSNDPDVKKVIGPYRIDFNNYIFTPIFMGQQIFAMLDVSWKDTDRWTQDDVNMTVLFSNILTSVFQKQMVEQQLIAAKEQAEYSNRSKTTFLASMSHEIRTPMNAILGMTEIQIQSRALSPETEEAFGIIYDSGNLLMNIINDILDLSKIEAGKLEIVPVRYDIPSLVNDTIQLNRLRYESKPLEFDLIIDENTPLDFIGDEIRIKQILNNLLSNAFKYTEQGGVKFAISAEFGEGDDVTLILSISDTGQGLTTEQITRLFDEYSRFNLKTNRTIVGAGLGMSITKMLVDLMDGQIMVESEPDKGSTFTVRLPQKRVGTSVCGADLADKMTQLRFKNIASSQKTQIMREYMPYGSVLVVDDVESNLIVAKGLLLPYGLKLETATSGYEAIERIKGGGVYDIIFMDHMMPHLDGIETVKIIHDMGYKKPIIALTANALTGQAEVFMSNGFDGFLAKPIDLRELNIILNAKIRDIQSPETIKKARTVKYQMGPQQPQNENNTEILKAFVADAEKSFSILKQKVENGGTGLYTTTVHGLKSALANIGEIELSSAAYMLEKAGREGDYGLIAAETPSFLEKLKTVVANVKLPDEATIHIIADDDKTLLREKLAAIHTACTSFDKRTAKAALAELKKKTWTREVNELIESISTHLLHGTFKEAAILAGNAEVNMYEGNR